MADDDVDLDCPVCLEPYNLELREPKVLSCSGAHELCQACALKMRCDGSVGGRDIKCPHCRETISAGRPINTNRGLVAALKQKANAEEERNQLKADAAAAKARILRHTPHRRQMTQLTHTHSRGDPRREAFSILTKGSNSP